MRRGQRSAGQRTTEVIEEAGAAQADAGFDDGLDDDGADLGEDNHDREGHGREDVEDSQEDQGEDQVGDLQAEEHSAEQGDQQGGGDGRGEFDDVIADVAGAQEVVQAGQEAGGLGEVTEDQAEKPQARGDGDGDDKFLEAVHGHSSGGGTGLIRHIGHYRPRWPRALGKKGGEKTPWLTPRWWEGSGNVDGRGGVSAENRRAGEKSWPGGALLIFCVVRGYGWVWTRETEQTEKLAYSAFLVLTSQSDLGIFVSVINKSFSSSFWAREREMPQHQSLSLFWLDFGCCGATMSIMILLGVALWTSWADGALFPGNG